MTPANPPFIQETLDSVKVMLPQCQESEKIVQCHTQNMVLGLDRKPVETVQLHTQNMVLGLDRELV